MLESGEYASAAAEFRDLASIGEANGRPRSTQAHVLAGRAYLLAGMRNEGMEQLKRSVDAATRFGVLPHLARIAPRVASELRDHGFNQEAEAFIASLEAALNHPLNTAAPAPAKQAPRLPPKCPYYGGTIHPGEAEWIDERSIACDYCGSVVQAVEG